MDFVLDIDREQLQMLSYYILYYVNRYTSCAMFYFDWKALGDKCRYDLVDMASEPEPDLSRRIHIGSGRKIRISWEKLNLSVCAYLATNENRDLCAAFIEALPFETLHVHATISSASTDAWTPMVITAPAPTKERQCDDPIGRLRLSQATGMKLVIQYGKVTEDIEMTVLGEILPECRNIILSVGEALWNSTYHTKEEIKVKVELFENPATRL